MKRFASIVLACLLSIAGCSADGPTSQCAGVSGTCRVAEHDANEPVRRGELDGLLKAYLDEHPEVIAESGQKLRLKQLAERQAKGRQALVENRPQLFEDAADPVLGNPKGDVTVVEFFDNECPFCKKLSPTIERLISLDPEVRIVLKEYPILGPGSESAARYALAAMRQGKYLTFHNALMADKTPEHQLTEPRILELAAQSGMNVDRLKADAAQQPIINQIEANRALARKLTITGTPGLIIGDKIESGALTLEALQQAVAEVRRAKQVAG